MAENTNNVNNSSTNSTSHSESVPINTGAGYIIGSGTYMNALSSRNGTGIGTLNIGKTTQNIVKKATNIPSQAIEQEMRGTDVGRGFVNTKLATNIITETAILAVTPVFGASEKIKLDKSLDRFNEKFNANSLGITRPTTIRRHSETKDISELLRLKGVNDQRIVGLRGKRLENYALRQVRMGQKRGMSGEVLEVYKEAAKVGKYTRITRRGGIRYKRTRRLNRKLKQVFRRSLGNDEVRESFRIIINPVSRMAVKTGIKTIRFNTRAVRFAMKKSALGALKLAHITAKKSEKINKAVKTTKNMSDKVKQGNVIQKSQTLARKAKNIRTKTSDKLLSIRNAPRNLRRRISNRAKKQSKIFTAFVKKQLSKTKAGKMTVSVMGKTFKFLLKPLRFIGHLFSGLKVFFMKAIAFLVAFFIIIVIILFMITAAANAVYSMFVWSGDEDRTELVINKLNELYTNDLNMIAEDYAQNYYQVEIEYEDVKDVKEYKKHNKDMADKSWKGFSQSTNCVEIMAMTNTKFPGIDSSKYSNKEILDYVTQVYYGTHDIIVKEYTEKVGNEERKSAVVTYRTYYFENAFTCELKQYSDYKPVYTDSNSLLVCSEDDVYVNLRESGYTHAAACGILGNLKAESGIDPKSVNSSGYMGIAQWGGGRKNNLKSYASRNGLDVMSLSAQIGFLKEELDQSYMSVRDKIKNSKDIDYCTSVFCAGFEGCYASPDNHPEFMTEDNYFEYGKYQYWQALGKRKAYAHEFDEKYSTYKKDWSELINNGLKIAEYAASFAEKIHYTQGTSGFVGSRYMGSDLSSITTDKVGRKQGTDCSGFVYSVYKHFGLTVPQGTGGYGNSYVIDVNNVQPGDILFSPGHVEIYIGNGKTMGLHDAYCVTDNKCNRDSNINENGLEWFKNQSGFKVYRYWK